MGSSGRKCILYLFVIIALLSATLADNHDHDHDDDHDHDHDHGHDHTGTDDWPDCECIVDRLDCSDQARVSAAARYLNANNCKDKCMDHSHDHDEHGHDHDDHGHDHGRLLSSNGHHMDSKCATEFMVLDMYHAGCVAGDLPAEIGIAFHEFDEYCYRCYHPSAIIPGEPNCPLEACDNPQNVTRANEMLNDPSKCPTDNLQEDCKDYFRILLTYHDFCPRRDDVRLIGYHTLEQVYEGVHCNFESEREKNCGSDVNREFATMLDGSHNGAISNFVSMLLPASLIFTIQICSSLHI